MNSPSISFKLKKLAKPIGDLVIVIAGVSVAFLLNSWNESKKEHSEKIKVLSSLHTELQSVEQHFPSFASYQLNRIREWDSLKQLNQWAEFYNYRYLQPQYNYVVISYALETRNSNIVNFALHEKLLQIYTTIKKIEQAEIYMTEIALQYQPLPTGMVDPKQTERNMFLYSRFIVFAKDRATNLKAVAELTKETLPLVKLSN